MVAVQPGLGADQFPDPNEKGGGLSGGGNAEYRGGSNYEAAGFRLAVSELIATGPSVSEQRWRPAA